MNMIQYYYRISNSTFSARCDRFMPVSDINNDKNLTDSVSKKTEKKSNSGTKSFQRKSYFCFNFVASKVHENCE